MASDAGDEKGLEYVDAMHPLIILKAFCSKMAHRQQVMALAQNLDGKDGGLL